MSHCHNHGCEHKNLAYCGHCGVVYCKDCHREWRDNTFNYFYKNYPWQWQQYGNGVAYKTAETICNTGGKLTGMSTNNLPTACNHEG